MPEYDPFAGVDADVPPGEGTPAIEDPPTENASDRENDEGENPKDEKNDDPPEVQVPEEKIPEEDTGEKYRLYNEGKKGDAIAAIGDHASVTIYNYISVVKQAQRERDLAQEDKEQNTPTSLAELLQLNRWEETYPVHANNSTTQEKPEMSTWYYQLHDFEQCYVQAAAILQGALANEISLRADLLFWQQKQEASLENPPREKNGDTVPIPTPETSRPFALLGRSGKILHEKTYLFTERIDGKERLFWKDVDVYGISDFGLQLLDFLAREYVTKGLHGQQFLKTLVRWSEEVALECSGRAARALGIFLWRRNTEELYHQASRWSGNERTRNWYRIAMLLDGAYEIDQVQSQAQAGDSGRSPALHILQAWLTQSQQILSHANIYRCCAVAQTYGLIGKRNIAIALQGLEQLAHISGQEPSVKFNLLANAVATTYLNLSRSGHIRDVLAHLAQLTERLLPSHERSQHLHKRATYRRQRLNALHTILEAFFLIVATSIGEIQQIDPAAYKRSLPTPPVLPDPARDLLLSGILNREEEQWRHDLLLLLGGAVIEKRYRTVAFGVFTNWANIVDKLDEALKNRFQDFLVDIGKTIEGHIGQGKEFQQHILYASSAYKYRLELWQRKKEPIGSIAPKVLQQLS